MFWSGWLTRLEGLQEVTAKLLYTLEVEEVAYKKFE